MGEADGRESELEGIAGGDGASAIGGRGEHEGMRGFFVEAKEAEGLWLDRCFEEDAVGAAAEFGAAATFGAAGGAGVLAEEGAESAAQAGALKFGAGPGVEHAEADAQRREWQRIQYCFIRVHEATRRITISCESAGVSILFSFYLGVREECFVEMNSN